jgi:4-amino-4-deoxy-L-arabinose transferase-like glycosyltransferase
MASDVKANGLGRSSWSTLAVVMLLCALTMGVRVGNAMLIPIHPVHDEWDHIAENLAAGKGYVSSWPKTDISPTILNLPNYDYPLIPTAARVPVPVIYFALMYRLFGVSDRSLVIGQIFLDTLTCALLFLIAMEVFNNRRVAILTCVGWALYPLALWMSNSRYAEPMIAFLLAALIYVLLIAMRTKLIWQFGLAGIIWGLATLSRPTVLTLPVFLFPVLVILLRPRFRFAIQACLVITLGGVLVIAPWAYRNYQVYHAFVPTSTLGGRGIFRDHYLIDRADYLVDRGWYTVGVAAKEMFDRRFGSVAVLETGNHTEDLIDRTYREEAFAKILQNPDRYIVLSLVRLLRLWFNVGYGTPSSWRSYLILIGHLSLVGLTIAAHIFYKGSWATKMILIYAILVQHTLVFMAMVGDIRYSIPVAPYLIMVSAYVLVCTFDKVRKPQG